MIPPEFPAAGKRKPDRKQRLDLMLVARQLVESREQARRLIMAGQVLVDEAVSDKPGRQVAVDATVRLRSRPAYVSRGGEKLAAALAAFQLDVSGKVVVDIGASTGGFTDCLLQHGAARAIAVDVGYGQLAWKLRIDPRVLVLERTNIRRLQRLPGDVLADLAVVDVSFIGLQIVLPPTLGLLHGGGQIVALIKPQFQAGKGEVGKRGVVRDPAVHRRVIGEVMQTARDLGLFSAGLIVSPLRGPAGNVEFLIWLRRDVDPPWDLEVGLSRVLEQARHVP